MQRRRRTGYDGQRYPDLRGTMDRRRFLTRMGAASGLVLFAGLGRARALYASDGASAGLLAVLPTTEEWWAVQPRDRDHDLYYQAAIEVVSEDLRLHLEIEQEAILSGFDGILERYSRDTLLDESERSWLEEALLEQLLEDQAAVLAEEDVTGLGLEVSYMPYGDDWGVSGGCSCSSVQWRGRRS